MTCVCGHTEFAHRGKDQFALRPCLECDCEDWKDASEVFFTDEDRREWREIQQRVRARTLRKKEDT